MVFEQGSLLCSVTWRCVHIAKTIARSRWRQSSHIHEPSGHYSQSLSEYKYWSWLEVDPQNRWDCDRGFALLLWEAAWIQMSAFSKWWWGGGVTFLVFMMNWTFRTTWLWWWRWWRCWWITMTIYSTELFQALSRLLRRRLSCFWFIFYYVSAMFIKRDTVIINKTTFTICLHLWVCVYERQREKGEYAIFVCRI